jgi:hypothetical protein
MIVSDNLPLDVDVINSAANIKKEVTYTGGYRLLAEPQGPKSRVITDDQTVINFPKLFVALLVVGWAENIAVAQ